MKTIRLESANDELTLEANNAVTIDGVAVELSSFAVDGPVPRTGTKDRYGKDGIYRTGDGRIGARSLSFNLTLSSESDNDFLAFYSRLMAMFSPEADPLYFYDDRDDDLSSTPVRARLLLRNNSLAESKGAAARIAQGKLTFYMVDSLFESQEEFEATTPSGGIESGETFDVENTSKALAYPVVEVTAQSDNFNFRLTNSATGGFVEVGTQSLTAGKTVVISSLDDGAIRIDEVDVSASAIGAGSTLFTLVPGINTFLYSSDYGAADITVRWRERWYR